MKNEGREARVTIAFTADELEALDGWRFGRRIGSRSEAVRQLIQLGLATSAAPDAPAAKKPKKATARSS